MGTISSVLVYRHRCGGIVINPRAIHRLLKQLIAHMMFFLTTQRCLAVGELGESVGTEEGTTAWQVSSQTNNRIREGKPSNREVKANLGNWMLTGC